MNKVNFIEKFNSLKSGEYLNSEYNIVKKEKKEKLFELFTKTTEQLKEGNYKNLKEEIYKFTNKINKKIFKKSPNKDIRKIDFLMLKIFRPKLAKAYECFLEELAKVYVRSFKKEYPNKSVVSLIYEQKFSYKFKDALKRVIYESIKNRKEFAKNGFLYKITNKKNVESYLIGTIRFGNKHMYKSLIPIINKSKELFTEAGNSFLLKLMSNSEKGLKCIMDKKFTNIAKKKKIKVHRLDSKNFLIKIPLLSVIGIIIRTIIGIFIIVLSFGIMLIPIIILNKKNALKNKLKILSMIDMWQNGNEVFMKEKLETSNKIFSIKDRNKKWLKEYESSKKNGLISILQNTKKTVTIAVGVLHLFEFDELYNDGLIKRFKENELTVERITEKFN